MPFSPHCGLTFTPEHIQAAHKNRDREPFQSAWNFLESTLPTDPIAALILDGFRWRIAQDAAAGEQAVIHLSSGLALDPSGQSYFDSLAAAVALAQEFELLRDHPAFTADAQSRWMTAYRALLDHLNRPPDQHGLLEYIWLGCVNLVSGIALDAEDHFAAGVETFRRVIDHEVRPEGYLPNLVAGGDGGSLFRELYAVGALVVMAEAASHVGLDLWSYSSRGISVNTAVAYVTYYYYYPDQWRWDEGITDETARPLYQSCASLFEIHYRRSRTNELKLLLDELRPCFNPFLGGLTTLTHPLVKRGLFY
jgi:hypothetical protein